MNANASPRCSRVYLAPLLLIAILSLPAIATAQLPSPDEPKFASVTLDVGKVVRPFRHRSVFQLVGVQPSQTVSVTLTYPQALARQSVNIEPLDGGEAIVPQTGLSIGLDGALTFQFRVGSTAGLYQVRVHHGSSAVALQFWALDNQHLDNSPPVLTAN